TNTVLGQGLLNGNFNPPQPFVLPGNAIEGLTLMPEFKFPEGNRVIKAVVSVPLTPQGNVGNTTRTVGDPMKLFIATHELVHLTGLTNKDHSPEAVPDFFCGSPQPRFDPKDPNKDVLVLRLPQITPKGVIPGVFAPPLDLSGRTVGLIQPLWR